MNRIRQLRKVKGYSQKELGDKINKSLYTISKWELGIHEPSHDDLHRLCIIFDASADYIMGFADTNDSKIDLQGDQLPKSLRDAGLEHVQLLRAYIDEQGGIHPDVQRELLRLIAEAKLLQDTDDPSK